MIYLTGGGPGALRALRRHFKAALREVDRPHPTVAYVGVASNDNRGFYAMIRAGLALGTATMKMARLASPRASTSAAQRLLEDADLIFFSGGDVEHGMGLLHERDLVKPLRSLAHAGKPMFGISAGSLMLAQEWVRFPGEEDDAKAELFPCLGIAPVHVDAHAEAENWSELRTLLRLLHQRGDRRPVGYGLTKKGALHLAVTPKTITITAMETAAPRVVVRGGRVVDETPLAVDEMAIQRPSD